MFNDDIAFVITEEDAAKSNLPLAMLAEIQLTNLDESLNKVESLSAIEWLKRIGYFAVSFLILFALLKLINWLINYLIH